MAHGLIIYFDGPDGVGKTTQLKLAAQALESEGRDVYITRTLGGTPIGELLREAMLSPNPRPAETDLHVALATQYALAADVLPLRRQSQIVLIDRSPLSIVTYQAYGDGLDSTKAYEAAEELLQLIKPDLLLTYTASAASLTKRRQLRAHSVLNDFFENKSPAYHKRVAQGFKKVAENFGAVSIEAEASVDKVHELTMRQIRALL